jgi:hypothetical protein
MSEPRSPAITRRTILRGVGTALAVPWLESLAPRSALAAGGTSGPPTPPLRMAFLYVPNGVNMKDWTPETEGADFALSPTLEPLGPYRDRLMVLSGLAQDNASAHGDGGGDHARSMACFLTGVHPKKTDGADIRAGVSVDQLTARKIGGATRFPSLELGIEAGRQAGGCDSGYSCAYSNNISWRSPTTPVPKEVNPRLVFERLFGSGDPDEDEASRARRRARRESVLDLVRDDATRLHDRLGAGDRRKLDEYLSSVRELEVRVTRAESSREGEGPEGLTRPAGIPREMPEHFKLMNDLLVAAFRGDLTRVATYMMANEGSNRSYPVVNVNEGHHELSHHGNDRDKLEKIARINHFHVEMFADLLGKLQAVPEGEGTLLDHMMIVYGSGIGDGNRHNHNELPIVLAGGGGGTFKTGRHLRFAKNTPLNNLYLNLMDRVGIKETSFGDSTGRLAGLDG